VRPANQGTRNKEKGPTRRTQGQRNKEQDTRHKKQGTRNKDNGSQRYKEQKHAAKSNTRRKTARSEKHSTQRTAARSEKQHAAKKQQNKYGDELDDDEIDFTFASGAFAALPIVSPEQGAALPIGSRPVQALSPLEWAQVHEALESADEPSAADDLESADEPSAKRFAAQSAVQALSQEAVNIATAAQSAVQVRSHQAENVAQEAENFFSIVGSLAAASPSGFARVAVLRAQEATLEAGMEAAQEAVNIATAEAAAGSAASGPGSPEVMGRYCREAAAVVNQEPGSAVKRLMGKALWVPGI
jgi:hypothetical protein